MSQLDSSASSTSHNQSAVHTALVFDSTDPNSPVLSLNMANVTKLVATNYIAWNQQVRFLLEGHGLLGFITEGEAAPPTVITEAGLTKPNPAYNKWKRQDRLIHSALLGAIANTTQSLVSCATSSLDVWRTLEKTYGRPSRGHLKQLKNQLKHSQKGNKSIDKYMRTIRAKADQLSLLGKPLDHEDLMDYVLDGLPEEYKAIVDAANGRETPMSFEELHEKLLNREADILHVQSSSSSLPATANAAQIKSRDGYQNRGNWNTSSSQPPSSTNHNRENNNNNNRERRPYLGKCQLCGVHGHSARWCSQSRQPSHSRPAGASPQNYQNSAPPGFQNWRPSAHNTMMNHGDANTWLLDSGASHHITSDLHNLSMHSPYHGNDNVLVGNGAALPITHTGEGAAHGDTAANRPS